MEATFGTAETSPRDIFGETAATLFGKNESMEVPGSNIKKVVDTNHLKLRTHNIEHTNEDVAGVPPHKRLHSYDSIERIVGGGEIPFSQQLAVRTVI